MFAADDTTQRQHMSNHRRSRTMSDARGDPARRAAVAKTIAEEMLAGHQEIRPGQIFPTQPGNGGQHLDETIAEALFKATGKKSIAAGWLGISRRTLEARIAESEFLQETLEDIEELRLDCSEIQLDGLISAGVDKAVLFHLKTKGKKRGYGESKTVEQKLSFTIDAARELQSKFRPAFDAIRQEAMAGKLLIDMTPDPEPEVVSEPPVAQQEPQPSHDADPDDLDSPGPSLLD